MKVKLISKSSSELKLLVDSSFTKAGVSRKTRFARECWKHYQLSPQTMIEAAEMEHDPVRMPRALGIMSQVRGSSVAVIIRAH